jgi:hypothetical protein
MEQNYSIEEILTAVNDLQSKKNKRKIITSINRVFEKKNTNDVPVNTLKIIEQAEKIKN